MMAYQSWNETEEDISDASDHFAEAQRKVRLVRIGCILLLVGAVGFVILGIGMIVEQGVLAGGPWIAFALVIAGSAGLLYDNLRFRAKALSLIHKLKRGETLTAHDHPA